MKTISFLAQKGGTGKTTLSVHMAMIAHQVGLRVLLIDLDPQNSTSDWFRSRKVPGPMTRSLKPGALFFAQSEARRLGFDLMIIDTQASRPDVSMHVARLSDLSLLVSRPTIIDLRAMRELAEGLRALKLATTIVINQAPVQRQGREPALMQEAIDILIQYGIPVAPIGIRSRIIYQVAMINGMSAVEVMTSGPAAEECKTLWEHITQRLGIEKNQFSRPRPKTVSANPAIKEMPQAAVNMSSQQLAQARR